MGHLGARSALEPLCLNCKWPVIRTHLGEVLHAYSLSANCINGKPVRPDAELIAPPGPAPSWTPQPQGPAPPREAALSLPDHFPATGAPMAKPTGDLHPKAKALLDAIRAEPGLSSPVLAADAGMPGGVAKHHLNQLRRRGFVRHELQGFTSVRGKWYRAFAWYPAGPAAPEPSLGMSNVQGCAFLGDVKEETPESPPLETRFTMTEGGA